jgi:tRNA 2-thiouridine synthesizing protein B
MTTLHILSHSPFTDSRMDSCLQIMGSEDGLLLCGDAVHALQPGSIGWPPLQALAHAGRLYALDEDITARAIHAAGQVIRIDYPAFVQLSIDFDKVNTWL